MIYTFTEDVRRVQLLDPQTLNNATSTSAYQDVSDAERVVFVLELGATDTTVDAKLVQATDASGTGAKDITGAAITQLAATDDNKQAMIEVQTNRLDINNGYRYVAAQVTVGAGTTGATLAGALYLVNTGDRPVTQPASVAQTVVVAG